MSNKNRKVEPPQEPVVKEPQIIPAVVAPEVDAAEPRSDAQLMDEAKAIVKSEIPFIGDENVANLGQDTKNYGKFQSVQEVHYEAFDNKSKAVVARTAIRIDH